MSISTISFNKAATTQIMRVQADLHNALVETATGRHADVGLALGSLTGVAVSYKSQETSLERHIQSNALVTQRLTLVDDAMGTVFKTADDLNAQLTAGLGTDAFLQSAQEGAASAIAQLTGTLNLSVGGQYLFAGTQTDLRPMMEIDLGPDGPIQTLFAQFKAAAGEPLKAEDVAAFFGEGFVVEGEAAIAFNSLFAHPQDGGGWSTNFSDASDQPIESRISSTETIETSVSANESAFRDLMAGYAALTLASSDMSEEVRGVLSKAAGGLISSGMGALTALQAEVGRGLSRIESANAAMTQQKDIFAAYVAQLEEIDLAEASERVAALQTQLEASLRVTALIREINILDYL